MKKQYIFPACSEVVVVPNATMSVTSAPIESKPTDDMDAAPVRRIGAVRQIPTLGMIP